MKYIKAFESRLDVDLTNPLKFWKIKTIEPYFSESLKMIGMDTYTISKYLGNQLIKPHTYIYVGYDLYRKYQVDLWGWCHIQHTNWYTKNGFKYIGEIEEHEIDAVKYNI